MARMSRGRRRSREEILRQEMEADLYRRMRPQTLSNMAGEQQIPEDLRRRLLRGRHDVAIPVQEFIDEGAEYYNPSNYQNPDFMFTSNFVVPVEGETDETGDLVYGPAEFGREDNNTEVPTATSNSDRPRTLAAAYNPQKEILTLMFRDGTVYNYYDVQKDLWEYFREQSTKGEFIKSMLDDHPRGQADMTYFPEEVRQQLFILASSMQRARYGNRDKKK